MRAHHASFILLFLSAFHNAREAQFARQNVII